MWLEAGNLCHTFACIQFSAGGIIKVPKFDVTMDKTEDNSKPVLEFEDVHIATM